MNKCTTVLAIFVATLCCAATPHVSGAQEDKATVPRDKNGEKIWDLTSYLKGTRFEIRDKLNLEVDRLEAKRPGLAIRAAEWRTDLKKEERQAVARVRATEEYKDVVKAIVVDEQKLDIAPPRDRFEISTRLRENRRALKTLEEQAADSDQKVRELREQVSANDLNVQRIEDAYQKASKWRQELIDLTKNTLSLGWPLERGAQGLLLEITPVQIVHGDAVFIEYRADEEVSSVDKGEGIAIVQSKVHKVQILISGIDVKGMREGKPLRFERNVEIVGHDDNEDLGLVYFARVKHSDADDLIQTMAAPRPLKK
ncbi:MAG TPA: hypothetical protein VFC78_06545 [Tepidisphaeraceae bacterium]|nr:hypothetical protein [Tepidisphaeraceae bacterium]